MNRGDFLKLMGDGDVEYSPVACLLQDGRGCAGYYNALLNEDLTDTCVLVNARIITFRERHQGQLQASIANFSEFIEEIVMAHYQAHEKITAPGGDDIYGGSIPLTAIAYDHIAVLYPVARIETLMRRAAKEKKGSGVPTFLDFDNKSATLKLLRAKLW